ncbi:periplasmic solute-binding family protein [Shuttleworthella sp. MSX8B]|uniref:metal ABC transporter substrate-binding protein n=1 Tax=Shuttleworthella sp. MSX8B TaxID=936574 RepID=UPI00044A2F0C|nr:metal ABC transporter substrate-binding protein [Shuttleworthia sp. MSX8B]EUB16254.1 periplasmic solute-binding family protein [Shuttleworthia sp. MSX8B]
MRGKRIAAVLLAGLCAFGLMACGGAKNSAKSDSDTKTTAESKGDSGKKLKIVTTIFPEYDWVERVLGDKAGNAEVTMLMDKGVDLHSFQPTVEDIAKVSSADVFVYVGGESDAWVEDALKNKTNPNQKTVNLMEVLKDRVKPVEQKEGMQENTHEDHEEGEEEMDEHVWLSLKNAKIAVDQIQKTLAEADPDNAEAYAKNAKVYGELLNDLDQKYQQAVDSAKYKTLVFGDRFPFRYLVNDYGLDYFAAFEGCDAESEASFETVAFLANKIKELKLPAVLTIEGETHKLAESIKQNSGVADLKVLSLDSMQSVKAEDVSNGATYLNVMSKNLDLLKQAMNG